MTEFEQMQIEQLKRLTDVLEDMNGELINLGMNIEVLSDCVGTVPSRYDSKKNYKFLRIAGSVDTGV